MPADRPGAAVQRAVTAAAVVVMLSVACGASGESDPGQEDEPPGEVTDLDAKPDLLAVLPDDRAEPPDGLEFEDLVVGEGEEAVSGDVLTVHFVGAVWSSGAEFDATWDRGSPYEFVLGADEVIEGWELGVAGMREGGRRVLVVPPELGYGDRGAAGAIGPGETLVFVIDVLERRPSSEPA